MREKYASFHIYRKDKENSMSLVKQYMSEYKKNNFLMQQRAVSVFSNSMVRDMLNRNMLLQNDPCEVVISEKFISVYEDDLGFETIVNFTKKLSLFINAPIFYISRFYDDVLVFGIFLSGKHMCCRSIGRTLDLYGMQNTSNMECMRDLEGFHNIAENEKFTFSENFDECENSIESVLDIFVKFDHMPSSS